MLNNIEKTFDSAFFNANHDLKFIEKFIKIIKFNSNQNNQNDNEQQLIIIQQIIQNITEQLSVMAFCFAQLMCKTILFSENCFILKEHLQRIQMENFHLKSDKLFMDFIRKINHLSVKKNHHQNDENKLKKRYTNRKKRKNYKTRTTINQKNNDEENNFKENNFENYLLYNLNRNDQNKILKNQHNNNHNDFNKTNVFKKLYKNFKEIELITTLKDDLVDKQKQILILTTKLSTQKQILYYLNNQLSGRIQQIQLLLLNLRNNNNNINDKNDLKNNFKQLWNDLELEISLNKYKTITNVLNNNNNNIDNDYNYLFNSLNFKQQIKNNEIINDNDDQDNDELKIVECKNFQKSWYNIGQFRFVIIDLTTNNNSNNEALGISITGGKEYGLPILISKIHTNTPAERSSSFLVGDIILSVNFIDFTDLTHQEAVDVLKNLSGKCRFGVIYLKINEKDENLVKKLTNNCNDNDNEKLFIDYYRSIFNSNIILPFQITTTTTSSSSSSSSTTTKSDTDNQDDDDNYPKISSISIQTDDDDEKSNESKLMSMLNTSNNNLNRSYKNAIPGMAKLIRN